MNDSTHKLSKDEVPTKFSAWLLAMGCPEDKIPGMDKISMMCCGEYYMIWRGLMEKVHPRDTVKQKRFQVFCDDIQKCSDSKCAKYQVITPPELTIWREHRDVKRERENLEKSIAETRNCIKIAVDKLTNKFAHCTLAKREAEEAWRRAWLLQTASEELRVQRSNLMETKSIAESLCRVPDCENPQINIEKCVSLISKQSSPGDSLVGSLSMVAGSNPVACSSIIQTVNDVGEDTEEQFASLVSSSAGLVWSQLLERRGALVQSLMTAANHEKTDIIREKKVTPQFILANTAALHGTLALNAMKGRLQLEKINKLLHQAISELSQTLSGQECELVVLRCELESSQARVATLSAILSELGNTSGAFHLACTQAEAGKLTAASIVQIDRDIVCKKDEIKNLLASLSKSESKIQKVRESLLNIFSGFHRDIDLNDKTIIGRVGRLEAELGSVTSVRQFYQCRRNRKPRLELSMELDASEHSYLDDLGKEAEPRFVDELRLYLKKFNLEANRKLILENGEKIWIFETLQSSVERLYEKWLSDDVSCSLIKPSVNLSVSLRGLIEALKQKIEMDLFASSLQSTTPKIPCNLENRINREEEERQIDKIKKRLQGNITTLEKVTKTIDSSLESIRLWSDNKWRNFLVETRKIDGKSYKEFEVLYLNSLNRVA